MKRRQPRNYLQFSLVSLLALTLVGAFVSHELAQEYRRRRSDASRIVPTIWNLQTGKNVLWRTKLGSVTMRSPMIAGDHIYVGTNNAAGYVSEYPGKVDLGVLLCVNKQDGEVLWQHSNEKLSTGYEHDWPLQGVTSRPCIENNRLWYVNNRCQVVCLDTEGFHDNQNDGPFLGEPYRGVLHADVIWTRDMIAEFGVQPHNLSTCTVAVWKDTVFAVTGNGIGQSHQPPIAEAPSFVALDKETGELLWSDSSPGQNVLHGQWASPLVARLGGVTQVLFPGGDGWLYSFDPAGNDDGTSRLLWKFDCNPKTAKWEGAEGNKNNLLHAPTIHDGLVYTATGQDPEHGDGVGCVWCIDPTRRGDVSPELVFNESDPTTAIAPKRVQACVEEDGDFTRPNPNSAAVWSFTEHDSDGDGVIEPMEKMDRSLSTVEIRGNLAFVSDSAGFLHCLDTKTGKQHWGFDLLCATFASPLVTPDYVYMATEDGDVLVFGSSADPKIAMPGGNPVQQIDCRNSITGTPLALDNVLYIVTRRELIAIAEP